MEFAAAERSPWLLAGTGQAGDAAPLPDHCDVVVAGAGVFGATCAVLLARHGLSVVLVDAGDPLQRSTTVQATAKATVGQGLFPLQISERHDEATAVGYVRATQRAMEFVAAVGDSAVAHADQFVYGEDSASIESVLATARLLQTADVDLADPPGDLPWPATGYCVPDQLSVHPGEYLQRLLAEAQRQGAHYLTHRPVNSISGRGPVDVTVGDAHLRARHVVIATHYPMTMRGGLFATLDPQRHFALLVSTPKSTAAMTQLVGPQSRSTRPVTSDQMVVVGEGHSTGTSPTLVEQRWSDLLEWASSRFGPADVVAHWAAQDSSNVADSLPIAGPVEPGSVVMTAAGFGGWGLTSGTIAAHQIAGRILGTTDHIWGDWSPRWPGLGGTGRLVKHQASIAMRLLGGLISEDPATLDDLPPGEAAILRDGLGQVAVYRDEHGAVHSVSARCTHMGCTVRWNDAERSWDCPCHGSRFDVTGQVLEGPAVDSLSPHPLAPSPRKVDS